MPIQYPEDEDESWFANESLVEAFLLEAANLSAVDWNFSYTITPE
eukprot:SAG11_NODE_31074_length_295_cov_0.785714_1_plen_44_part_01